MRQSSLEDQRSKLSLAVYVDSPFGEHEDGLLVHPESFGFLTFVAAVAEQFEALTVLGRESTGRSDLIPLGKANVKIKRFGALPESLYMSLEKRHAAVVYA